MNSPAASPTSNSNIMCSNKVKVAFVISAAVMYTACTQYFVLQNISLCFQDSILNATVVTPTTDDSTDITDTTTDSHVTSNNAAHLSYEKLVDNLITNEKKSNQRVVILAGPHKTGSTSIQNNFHEWTGNGDYLLKNWAWPVPALITKYEAEDENNWNWNPSKGFYALAELLRSDNKKIEDRLLFQKNTREELLKSYQVEFLRAWIAGYSLIIGSEAFDNVIKDDDGDEMIDKLLDLMPWNIDEFSNDSITVVVTYRVPRVKHLISIWRETKKKSESFMKWILQTRNNLGAIDSLGLAEKFLEKGLNVAIADISGISDEGYDVSNVVACTILDASCTDEMKVEGSKPPLIMNTKQNFTGKILVEQDRLELMDSAMKAYDCKYASLLKKYEESDKLKLLYPKSLMEVMKSCNNKGIQPRQRSEMKSQLVCIAEGKDNCFD